MFCRSSFVLLPIVLSVLLSFTASGCPFGISKLFLSAFSRYTIIFPYGYQIKITIKIHTGTQHSMSILTFLQVYVFLLFISIIGWDKICSNIYISVHLVNHWNFRYCVTTSHQFQFDNPIHDEMYSIQHYVSLSVTCDRSERVNWHN